MSPTEVRTKANAVLRDIVSNNSIRATTAGDGLWSDVDGRQVTITKLAIGYINDEKTFCSLDAHFQPQDWSVDEEGMIYTDRGFLTGFNACLAERGLPEVSYSEAGMQGVTFINFDCGQDFIDALLEKSRETN